MFCEMLQFFIVPLAITGFNIIGNYFTMMDIEVVFVWDPQTGVAVVDNYTISVLPTSISHPISNLVYSTSWNVTLDYNVIYNATITAQNCAGESEPFVLTNIQYG